MSQFASAPIRKIIQDTVTARGGAMPGERDALFTSGLLDSLAATEVLVALESAHGIDIGDEDFDISEIDTLEGIEQLVAARSSAAHQA